MKRIMILFMVVVLFLTSCGEPKERETDYSAYLFTDVIWTRDNGHDIETIIFLADGSFRYYCACGNPVNDSDLCERYTYNDETKEIKFDYLEITEDMLTTVTIGEMSEAVLELDFGGDIRIFEKEKES